MATLVSRPAALPAPIKSTVIRDRETARRALGWHQLPEGSAERRVIDLQLEKAHEHARNVGGSLGKEAWQAAVRKVASEPQAWETTLADIRNAEVLRAVSAAIPNTLTPEMKAQILAGQPVTASPEIARTVEGIRSLTVEAVGVNPTLGVTHGQVDFLADLATQTGEPGTGIVLQPLTHEQRHPAAERVEKTASLSNWDGVREGQTFATDLNRYLSHEEFRRHLQDLKKPIVTAKEEKTVGLLDGLLDRAREVFGGNAVAQVPQRDPRPIRNDQWEERLVGLPADEQDMRRDYAAMPPENARERQIYSDLRKQNPLGINVIPQQEERDMAERVRGEKLLPDLKTPWEFGLHVPGPADAIERSLEPQVGNEQTGEFAANANAAIEQFKAKEAIQQNSFSPEAEDFRDALSSRFGFSDDPRLQTKLNEFSNMAAERLNLKGKSPAEIEQAAEAVAAAQEEIRDRHGSFTNALEKVAGDRVYRESEARNLATVDAAETLGVAPEQAVNRFNELANGFETTSGFDDAQQARTYAVEQAKQAMVSNGATSETADALAQLAEKKWSTERAGILEANRVSAQPKSELWTVANELETQAMANEQQGEKTDFLRRSVVNVGEAAIAQDAAAKERLESQQQRATQTGLTVEQIASADAFDERFGSTAFEHLNGAVNTPSKAALLDQESVLRDQAENPASVVDLDATGAQMSTLRNTILVTANGQSSDIASLLNGAADDIDPETFRSLTQDTAQDRREDLARKAELYAASLNAAPDSSLGTAVEKFAGDVRAGKGAIDMSQWFAPQAGLSAESNERLAGQTHGRVMEGMKPLLQEANALGIQVDTGTVKIAQQNQVKEDVSVSAGRIGF